MDINVCYTHPHTYAYTYSMFFISPHRRMPLLATCYFDLELQVTEITFESSLHEICIFLLRNMETGTVIKLIFGLNNFIKDSSPFYLSVPPTSARRLLTSGFVTS